MTILTEANVSLFGSNEGRKHFQISFSFPKKLSQGFSRASVSMKGDNVIIRFHNLISRGHAINQSSSKNTARVTITRTEEFLAIVDKRVRSMRVSSTWYDEQNHTLTLSKLPAELLARSPKPEVIEDDEKKGAAFETAPAAVTDEIDWETAEAEIKLSFDMCKEICEKYGVRHNLNQLVIQRPTWHTLTIGA